MERRLIFVKQEVILKLMGLLTLLSSYTTVSSIKQWENRPFQE